MKSISEKKETAEENVIETVLEESSEETKDLSKEAKTEPVSKKKKSKRKVSKLKVRIIAAILVLAIAFGGFFGYKFFFTKEGSSGRQLTAVAAMGSVSSVIEGSGTLQALQQYEITSLKKGEVVEDFFEEGDTVTQGDILYRMDDEDGYDAIDKSLDNVSSQESNVDKTKSSLTDASDAIDNAQKNIENAQNKLNEAKEDLANLNVKSNTTGTISNLYISKGDNVNSGAKIADTFDDSKMILEIQFLSAYTSSMIVNSSSATVTLSKNGTVLYGTVTKISTGSVVNNLGASVTNVEITVNNPGAVTKGDYATAEVGEFACSSEGTFKYYNESTIVTEVSGKVESVNIMTGDKVTNGQLVAVLSNQTLADNVTNAQNTLDEANKNLSSKQRGYEDANDNITNAEESLQKAKDDYDDAVESLEDYVVRAPISGTIIQKNIKAGEKLEASTSAGAMAIIADLSSIVFEMSVDELDISKMKVGMDVEVTADAVTGVTFGAKITSISIVGTSNNGVTSYPVKITLNSAEEQQGMAKVNYEKLIPGMNVSARVVIEKVENVIVVPVSAVRRGNIVIVSEDSTSEGVSFGSGMGKNGFGGGNMPSEKSFGSDGFKMQPPIGSDGMPGKGGFTYSPSFGSDGMPKDFTMPQNGERPKMSENAKDNKKSSEGDKKASGTDNKNNDRMKSIMDSLDIPKGYKAIVVETGLSDETYIEIKNGLKEGDVVLLPDTSMSQGNNAMPGMGGMPGMGAMGGMPGGMGGMYGGMGGNRSGGMGGNRSGGMSGNRSGGMGR